MIDKIIDKIKKINLNAKHRLLYSEKFIKIFSSNIFLFLAIVFGQNQDQLGLFIVSLATANLITNISYSLHKFTRLVSSKDSIKTYSLYGLISSVTALLLILPFTNMFFLDFFTRH